jgi:NADH:ubiquinone oxidoreductase subunit E
MISLLPLAGDDSVRDAILQVTRYIGAMEQNPERPFSPGFIGVCQGPRCGDYGGRTLLEALQERGVDAISIACQSLCPSSPVVRLADRCLHRATAERVLEATGHDPEAGES